MYIHSIQKVIYKDPWQSDFYERLNSLKKGEGRVAYYYEKPDSSTFRYRVYNMIQAISESPINISSSYFWGNELEKHDEIISNTDVIVICRARYTAQLSKFISIARNKGKLIFFDIDDFIFNPSFTHLVVDTLNYDLNNPITSDFWFSFIAQEYATLNLCDYVITTNSFIAEQIIKLTGKKAYIVPNFLNREQYELSIKIIESKKNNGFLRNNKFHLGYFSGSPTHTKDLGVAFDAIIELLTKYKNLNLRIVGYMGLHKPFKQFPSQIERYPMQDYLNLQRIIGDVELNLIPLQDNIFTNCKSELKFFEAGITGTVSIASPIFSYANSIVDGKNGFLCKSHQWFELIESLINDPKSLENIALEAKTTSEEKFLWKNHSNTIINILFPNS